MPERSRALGWIRLLMLYSVLAALVAMSRPTPGFLLLGAIFALLGESLRFWAAGHLIKSVHLVTSGPYARCQNPLYLGRLLILTGLLVAARDGAHLNLAALAAGQGLFFFYYLPRKLRVEGERLARRHGAAYEVYRRSVPRLIPSLRRFPGEGVAWSVRRVARNREPLVLTGILMVFGLLIWRCARP